MSQNANKTSHQPKLSLSLNSAELKSMDLKNFRDEKSVHKAYYSISSVVFIALLKECLSLKVGKVINQLNNTRNKAYPQDQGCTPNFWDISLI